jgi:glycosyltransferase involved in cell wall biosynthesis
LPVRILHIHSTFSLGGKEARAVRLMNMFGDHARHSVISTVPGALGARDAIDAGIVVDFPEDHPPVVGKPAIGRYRALSRYMRGFDLVLTYNWGAMDAVGARRLFGGPPLVHHEDGFNQDEAQGQKPARLWFRRLMLGAAHAVVVPSYMLETIALTSWRQPRGRVHRIANGIALDSYQSSPARGGGPQSGGGGSTLGEAREGSPLHHPTDGAPPRAGEDLVVGTVAGLRAVKNLPRLVRAFAAAGIVGRLRIVGEGPERGAIELAAMNAGISDRLELPGFNPHPASALREFDIFALSSDSEQQPISLIEAMASGLPVVSTDVGDVRQMIAEENLPFIVPCDREDLLATAIRQLVANPELRRRIGRANRAKALQNFDEAQMIAQYRALYSAAIGQRGSLGS